MEMVHDRCSTLLTEFGTALTTILPILFQYCYVYCYSDSRNLWAVMKAGGLALYNLIQPTISLEIPVPSQGHYGFHSFPVVDWFCLFIYLWVLTFPFNDEHRCHFNVILPIEVHFHMLVINKETKQGWNNLRNTTMPDITHRGYKHRQQQQKTIIRLPSGTQEEN
jgi:hypothetical protein